MRKIGSAFSVLASLVMIASLAAPAGASAYYAPSGKCVITSDGVVLRGWGAADYPADVDWRFMQRVLPDGAWGLVREGFHERIDVDSNGYTQYRFRSNPHPMTGMAYKLTFRFVGYGAYTGTAGYARYSDSKPNKNCVTRP